MGFPGDSDGKESACSAGDAGLIPELRRSLFYFSFFIILKIEVQLTYNFVLGLGVQQNDSNVWASLVAQLGENLPAVQETQVRSLSWEDPCFVFFFPLLFYNF